MNRVEAIRRIIPDCTISSDIITGFCTETEDEHQDTLTMIEWADYSMSYMFFYSERPGTLAARKYVDDIPLELKKRRLSEIIRLQNQISFKNNQRDIGKTFKVLIEGDSKKSNLEWKGRNSQNKMLIFPKIGDQKPGDYVYVRVNEVTSATLRGEEVAVVELI
jgi:tRNA-2-methylthio-N6-dimethylallyladenosine synthase